MSPLCCCCCCCRGDELAWFVLASHNLSGAAWGKLEKKGTQLNILHYEVPKIPSTHAPAMRSVPLPELKPVMHVSCSLQGLGKSPFYVFLDSCRSLHEILIIKTLSRLKIYLPVITSI